MQNECGALTIRTIVIECPNYRLTVSNNQRSAFPSENVSLDETQIFGLLESGCAHIGNESPIGPSEDEDGRLFDVCWQDITFHRLHNVYLECLVHREKGLVKGRSKGEVSSRMVREHHRR